MLLAQSNSNMYEIKLVSLEGLITRHPTHKPFVDLDPSKNRVQIHESKTKLVDSILLLVQSK